MALTLVAAFSLQGEVTEPLGAGWINVSATYGAVPDDGIDDTAAIQQAISENIGVRTNMRTLYFPDGVYNISDTIEWKNTAGEWKAYIHLQGQSREGTILRLDDSTFINASLPHAVLYTASSGSDSTGNTAFANYIQDMTIDIGSGNPGAIGIDYIASNVGSIRRVKIHSSDAQRRGRAGILMDRNFAGPALLDQVIIEGFDYGIDFVNENKYSMTFKDVTLNNQCIAGIRNNQNALAIQGLISNNSVPVLIGNSTNGHTVILDSTFNNGALDNYAIEFRGALLLRDVAINGYKSSPVRNNNDATDAGSAYIDEYLSHASVSQFPSPNGTLRLPVQLPPLGPSDPNDDWVKVGARNSAGVQAAIDNAAAAGKTTVYFPNGQYNLATTITVHGSVRRFVGNHAFLNWDPSSGDTAVFELNGLTGEDFTFEQFILSDWASGEPSYAYIRDLTTIPIVFRDIMQTIKDGIPYTHTQPKDIYMVNCAMGEITFNHARVWAWQLDPENNGPTKIINNGGDLWILGFKTEWNSTSLLTSNGGRSEVLGAMFYVPFGSKSYTIPAVISSESQLSLSMTCYGDFNDIRIRDIRDGLTRDYTHADSVADGHPRDGRTVPLYNSWLAPAAPYAPTALAVTAELSDQVDLVWTDNASTEDAFLIERRTPSEEWQTLASGLPTNSTSFSDHTVSPNSTYLYRVFATASGIASAPSNEVSATTPPLEVLPSLITATALDAQTIELVFSEALQAGATIGSVEDPARYSMDQGIQVLNASRQADPRVVRLTTTALPYDNPYTLHIDQIKAEGGSSLFSVSTSIIFLSGSPYHVLTTVSDFGQIVRTPDQISYTSGTSVALTAVADSNYVFSHWSGDLSGSTNPATITINQPSSVTAHFVVDTSALFAVESFEYTAALTTQDGGIGWAGPWTRIGGDDWAAATGLTHPSAISPSGNASFGNQDKTRRLLDRTYGNNDASTLYLSFLMQADNDPQTGLWSNFELLHEGDNDANRKMSIGLQDNSATDFRIRLFNNNNFTTSIAPADTSVHQFVVRFEFNEGNNNDMVSVWMDPGLPGAVYAEVPGAYDFVFDRVVLSSWRQNMTIDEIRFGPTWQSVTAAADPMANGYLSWANGFITPPDGDEINDGVANLIAYGLGAAPSESALQFLPTLTLTENFVYYSIPLTPRSDLLYEVHTSTDLSTWERIAFKSTSGAWIKETLHPWSNAVTLDTSGGGALLVAGADQLPAIRFFRLSISLP
jgi:hypothetical protein